MACAEDEAVAVEPFRISRIALERFAKEDGTDFSGTEGQAEVAGGALVHGVHGETTGFVGGLSEEGFVHEQRAGSVRLGVGESAGGGQTRRAFFTGTGVGFKVENWGESDVIALARMTSCPDGTP